MDFKQFFFTDNKSGWKTNARLLEKNFPEVYTQVLLNSTAYGLTDIPFKEQIWYFINGVTERKRCICGTLVNFRGNINKGFNEFCSQKCFNSNAEENTKRVASAMKKKYGVEFFSQHESWDDKVKQTKQARYGDPNYNNIGRMRQTKLEKYGSETYHNPEKLKATLQTKDKDYFDAVQEKVRKTSIEKYGAEHFSKTHTFKNDRSLDFYKRYPQFNFIKEKHTFQTCTFICTKCGDEITLQKAFFRERIGVKQNPCTTCVPIGTTNLSSLQLRMKDLLIKHGVSFDENVTKYCHGRQQLDFMLKDKTTAIEVNGNYFHCELFRNSQYHLNKTISCELSGVTLMHFFEDEILEKEEIVASIILNKINRSQRTVYGRKTIICEIDVPTYRNFMNLNHIQGYSNSSVRLGLFSGDELVSAMGFAKTRLGIGKQGADVFEMIRFANKKFTSVVGAANKLFQFFIKNYKPKKVITYADRRMFSGGVYKKLGFVKSGVSKPNYWYVISGKRYHRFNFRKTNLIKDGFDPTKTEKEIMLERGIYRIYDCGVIRYEYHS